jgi:hypothetical protein
VKLDILWETLPQFEIAGFFLPDVPWNIRGSTAVLSSFRMHDLNACRSWMSADTVG